MTIGMVEESGFAFRHTFVAQSDDDSLQQGQRPFAVKRLVRARRIGWVKMKALICALPIERKMHRTATTLLPL